MHRVIIALGSNRLPAAHIQWASERMGSLLEDVRFSRRLWTEDIHGTGIYYMNRLAVANTTLSMDDLQHELKAIEAATGRSRQHVTIDLDLMLYDEQRFHERDWSRPYIQQLLPGFLLPTDAEPTDAIAVDSKPANAAAID